MLTLAPEVVGVDRPAGATPLLDSGAGQSGGAGGVTAALPSGTHAFGATAPGFRARFASETVTSGDVWESLGPFPDAVPAHWVTSSGPGSWAAWFQAAAASPIWFAYAGKPASSAVSIAPYGILWPEL